MSLKETLIIAGIIIISFTPLFFFGGVTDDEIKKCQAATNYSAERCLHEIMR